MARIGRLDDTTAERLLSGVMQPDDTPPGFAGVAHLLNAARPTAAASAAPRQILDALVEAVDTPNTPRRKSMLAQLLSAKVATLAVGALAVSATGAAAATGNLPDAAQNRVAAIAENVGVTLPTSTSQTAKDVRKVLDDDSLSGRAKGEAVSDAAKGDHGTTGEEKSADARATAEENKAAAEEKKAAAEVKADAGKANAPEHPAAPTDPAADTPAATPNEGGTGAANEASERGAATAEDRTDAATAGSENSRRP